MTHNNNNKKNNRLVGWLVSYQNAERGSYYELREGRSFVGSGIIQGERIISMDSKEFSTAHAVLNASPEHRVMIQDIFSQSGTFVSKSGHSDEVPANGPIELSHGDWIRLGNNLKFQVCLIDGCSK